MLTIVSTPGHTRITTFVFNCHNSGSEIHRRPIPMSSKVGLANNRNQLNVILEKRLLVQVHSRGLQPAGCESEDRRDNAAMKQSTGRAAA
jgi:hypothetical protein